MITNLVRLLDVMADDELKRANEDHGERFYSHHEAYAVTLEEAQEAIDELVKVTGLLHALWSCIKLDYGVKKKKLEQLDMYAINGAAELIQVAAMARKWKESGLK